MKLKIEIAMDNAAFATDQPASLNRVGWEPARILRRLAEQIDSRVIGAGEEFPLIDHNGNKVGKAKVTR